MAKDPASEVMDARTSDAEAPFATSGGATFFGQPRGLATLFFTEMWERFSYYGMRALLVLFMTAAAAGANPGLGFDDGKATAIYGLYTAMVYLLALPGGWVADNLWGQRRAVFVGGCIIAAGHFAMAVPTVPFFYLGLFLIVIGTGLLKPNVSTMVGDLYPEGGARRDAGFSVFYMGINLGAFLGPILCGLLGEGYNWHWGFSLAGFGMVLGLVQYKLGGRHLGAAGSLTTDATQDELARRSRLLYLSFGVVVALVLLLAWLMNAGILDVTLEEVATALGYGIIALAVGYFLYLFIAGGHTAMEKRRLGVIFWLFILAAIFWSGFEQAGSSLNLFADRLTDRTIAGWEMPRELASVGQLHLHHHPGARLWDCVDVAGPPQRQPVDSGQVRLGAFGAGGGLFRAGVGRGERHGGQPRLALVARGDVLSPHRRRVVPEPGRPLLHHEAGPARAGRADDGRLVRRGRSRQPVRGPCGGQPGDAGAELAFPDCGDDYWGGGRAGTRRESGGAQADGRREVTTWRST